MDWIQVFTIIGVLGGFMFYLMNRIDGDLKSLGDRVDKFGARLDGHAMRIDQLYKMFVDLLKERK